MKKLGVEMRLGCREHKRTKFQRRKHGSDGRRKKKRVVLKTISTYLSFFSRSQILMLLRKSTGIA